MGHILCCIQIFPRQCYALFLHVSTYEGLRRHAGFSNGFSNRRPILIPLFCGGDWIIRLEFPNRPCFCVNIFLKISWVLMKSYSFCKNALSASHSTIPVLQIEWELELRLGVVSGAAPNPFQGRSLILWTDFAPLNSWKSWKSVVNLVCMQLVTVFNPAGRQLTRSSTSTACNMHGRWDRQEKETSLVWRASVDLEIYWFDYLATRLHSNLQYH